MIENKTSEVELLSSSLAGNTEAFGIVIQRYQSLICAITYSATGNLAKSEELAQETFIRAWKELAQLKNLDKFRVWLCTIARNIVRKSINREHRDIIDDAQSLEEATAIELAESEPSQIAISKEQENMVWQALQEIPEKYREPMVLFYRQQQSVSNVAAELGLSEDATKQRLSRGRRLLKKHLAALVEETLGKTGPGKMFTIAVVAALPAIVPQAASAAIAGTTAKSSVIKTAFLSKLSGTALGPLVGVFGGLLGGLFGTWMSIKHTKSPRERMFMIKMSIIIWVALFLLICLPLILAMAGVIPKWGYWLSGVIFFILLIPTINWSNLRQQQIKKENGTYVKTQCQPAKLKRANVYLAFGGGIFGSLLWLSRVSVQTKDWAVLGLIFAAGVLIFLVATKLCLKARQHGFRIAIVVFIAIGLLHFLIVNLQWERWLVVLKYRYPPVPTLRQMNLLIGIVLTVLVIAALVQDFWLRKMKKKENQTRTDGLS